MSYVCETHLEKKIISSQREAKEAFLGLSFDEKKLFLEIVKMCLEWEEAYKGCRLYHWMLTHILETNVRNRARNVLKQLVKNGFLVHLKSKPGPGGFVLVEMPKAVFLVGQSLLEGTEKNQKRKK